MDPGVRLMKKSKRVLLLFVLLVFSPVLLLQAKALNCSKCGSVMVSEGVEEEGLYCTEPGVEVFICHNCKNIVRVSLPPRSHDYVHDTEVEPTCLEPGYAWVYCTRCESSYDEEIPPLGHYYIAYTVKEADCTHEGLVENICSRCRVSFTEKTPALGHDYLIEEDKQADCTHEGIHSERCSRCNDTITETTPALGHDYEEFYVAPSCGQEGERSIVCRLCGDKQTEVLPRLEHQFGDWQTVMEATKEADGDEVRFCTLCGIEEHRPIEKKAVQRSGVWIAAAVAGGLALGCFAFWKALKGSAKAAAVAAAEASAAESIGLITLKMKSLLLCWENTPPHADFEESLKKRAYLDIKKPGDAKVKPAMVIFDAASLYELSARKAAYAEEYPDSKLGCLASDSIPDSILKELQESGSLLSWAKESYSSERKLLCLVMPLYKISEESGLFAENATLLTDALGLPFLSTLLNLYVVGGDVKEAVATKGDMGTADWADMVNDVAGLFGLGIIGNAAEGLRLGADQKERIDDKRQ